MALPIVNTNYSILRTRTLETTYKGEEASITLTDHVLVAKNNITDSAVCCK